MSAAKTLIAMTSEGRSATTDDSVHDLAMLLSQMRTLPFPEAAARCANDIGHLEVGAGSSLRAPPGMLDHICRRYSDGFQRAGNCLQMASREMEVHRRISELGMSEQ
jgi:hypothetical protein